LAAAQHAEPVEAIAADASSSEMGGLANILSAVVAEDVSQEPNRQLLGKLVAFLLNLLKLYMKT
jgi:hypothetical protein